MIAREFISDVVPFLRTTDLGLEALNWMEIFRISHLPIVNNDEFLGLISDADIYDLNMADQPVGSHTLSLQRPFVLAHQHIYDAVELVSRLKLTIVPVLSDKNKYLGLITLQDLVQSLSRTISLLSPGGIIILEIDAKDYSLSEISQIVEGNNAKILSLYTSSINNSQLMEITLKINKTDLSSILQTFYRYEYKIKATFDYENSLEVLNKERLESFIHYLNV